ncbi:unnamed protein product [Heligmosomoides polygyrus]|uniref:DUF1534 domain-containing protein n=1 Tax=Heligmosomoides polygyrus TaxID=6339 RepID=A0A183FMC7_HELPZ|nr:unnamed protein product [Heligmosomoides polygyrus]
MASCGAGAGNRYGSSAGSRLWFASHQAGRLVSSELKPWQYAFVRWASSMYLAAPSSSAASRLVAVNAPMTPEAQSRSPTENRARVSVLLRSPN